MLKATGTLLRLESFPNTSSAARRPLLLALLLLSVLVTLHKLLVLLVLAVEFDEQSCRALRLQERSFQ
jgi:hypothetical protein